MPRKSASSEQSNPGANSGRLLPLLGQLPGAGRSYLQAELSRAKAEFARRLGLVGRGLGYSAVALVLLVTSAQVLLVLLLVLLAIWLPLWLSALLVLALLLVGVLIFGIFGVLSFLRVRTPGPEEQAVERLSEAELLAPESENPVSENPESPQHLPTPPNPWLLAARAQARFHLIRGQVLRRLNFTARWAASPLGRRLLAFRRRRPLLSGLIMAALLAALVVLLLWKRRPK